MNRIKEFTSDCLNFFLDNPIIVFRPATSHFFELVNDSQPQKGGIGTSLLVSFC